MPKPDLELRKVRLAALPVYTCAECGRRAYGTTYRDDLDWPMRPEDLGDVIRQGSISNNHMPIGWHGHGLYEHRCPDCAQG